MLTLVSHCLHIVLLCKLLITNIASSGYEVIFFQFTSQSYEEKTRCLDMILS